MDNAKKNEFVYLDSSNIEHRINISDNDFKLSNKDAKIHDTKFKTKPTTFFKDAFKRFTKNKSSVAGGIILGTLLLMSIIVPLVDTSDIDTPHPTETFLEPKLFDYNGGFWDGSKWIEDAACDTSKPYDDGKGNVIYYPYESSYPSRAVKDLSLPRPGYINNASRAGKGGYANVINLARSSTDSETGEVTYSKDDAYLNSQSYSFKADNTYSVKLTILDQLVKEDDDGTDSKAFIEANFDVNLVYTTTHMENGELVEESFEHTYFSSDAADANYTKSSIVDELKNTINLKTIEIPDLLTDVKEEVAKLDSGKLILSPSSKAPKLSIKIKAQDVGANLQMNESVAFKSIVFNTNDEEEAKDNKFQAISFTDANAMVQATAGSKYYFEPNGTTVRLYHGIGQVCSFRFDTYEAAYGNQTQVVGFTEIQNYIDKGWISSNFTEEGSWNAYLDKKLNDYFLANKTDLTDKYCPIISMSKVDAVGSGGVNAYTYTCQVSYYKYLGYTSMPRFIAGTDKFGKDMFKQVFVGLRTSLLLGILTFAICFSFGLVWGSISGYFGGTVDLIMERFTDILSGVPWIVVMTLCVLNLGSNFFVFILAMCLTGWIGTSHLTRTQFYRFRDREYTLASRTLGARDARLIFRHILPNAMGTIITSSVLMIPSVIFSEATLSYLGLGFNNLHSLGVILSSNQGYLQTYPILIIFPSIIMALIMISFNLFGNGLRDAFNPSLKGSD